MKKLLLTLLFSVILMTGMSNTVLHSQSFNLKIGMFHPNMESDLWEQNMIDLALQKQDMRAAYYGLEYEQFLNRYISLSVEGGYYNKEHLSFYRDWEYDDGSPIYQNLALRIVSVEADLKLYPLGYQNRITPYLGGGAGMYFWKYEQWGDFIIDPDLGMVSEDEYAETTTNTFGFNAKAGIVMRFGRGMGVSLEAKYQFVKGELSSFFEGWEKFDLSGFTYTIGINLYLR
jgi:hypothetical protein